tara:strand:+ start:9731 stop:10198 length:468 start_codon:yes stop_codon:yes gene_type:complete
MHKWIKQLTASLALTAFACGAAFADKPESPGNSGKNNSSASNNAHSANPKISDSSQPYFSSQRTSLIRDYYLQLQASGNCPPGLAKKNNGCQPPGQAKKWQKGDRLPRDLTYYDLPDALLNELGRTPEGQKIIRVGTAVLLINVASGLIIDAIED